MAKKKSSGSSFVMSQEILDILTNDPSLKGKEVIEVLQERFPKEEINESSASVAYSIARKKLGLTKSVSKSGTSGSLGAVDYSALKAARDFVTAVGTTSAAMEALKQLEELQIE